MISARGLSIAAVAVITVAAIACGRAVAPQVQEPRRGGTVSEATFADAVAIQPLLTSDAPSTDYSSMIYSPLLRFDQKLNLTGELAESFSVADGGSSIVMTLRPNLTWSDGAPLTSADVVFTWQKMMDPSVRFPFRSLYEGVFQSVEGPDPRTIVFNLKDACGPALVTAGGFQPIPEHIFNSVDINDNPYNMKPPVSSGVWTLKEWVKDSHAIFEANDRHWAGRANLDSYVIKIVADQTAAYTQFRTGEVDTVSLDPPQFDESLTQSNTTAYRYFVNGAAWDYIGFNLRDPRFQDVRVRQAFSHSMDRGQMIDTIRQGFSKPQYSIFPVTSPVFAEDVTRYDYDPELARALLKDAGWAPGSGGVLEKDGQPFEVRLFTNTGNKRREAIATRSQAYLSDVGVKVDIISEEFASLTTRMNKAHDFDLVIGGWTGGVEPNGQSNVWKKDSPQNAVGYDNPTVENLFSQGASECSMDARRPYYQQIQSIIASDAPYIFLWTNENSTGMSKRVQGVQPGPLPMRWNVRDWFVN